MHRPVVRHSIAVAVVAAVMLTLLECIAPGAPGSAVTQEKKEEAGLGFTYRERLSHQQQEFPKPFETTALLRVSPEYGSRKDTYEQGKVTRSEYHNYADGTTITLYHSGMRAKTYTRQDGPKGPPASEQAGDPRPRIKKVLAGEHTKLGRRTIDGVEADGIEAPAISGTVTGVGSSMSAGGIANTSSPVKIEITTIRQFWSSVETGAPVLVEENMAAANGAFREKRTLDQFRWNVRLDPNEFQAKIPPEYRRVEQPQLGQRVGGSMGGARQGPAATPPSRQRPRR